MKILDIVKDVTSVSLYRIVRKNVLKLNLSIVKWKTIKENVLHLILNY